ncbi:glycosyltransferase [[Clostridium] fimetarium]|uniref:Glycosyltransferase involved in cell wall bisynthesis n=1 Tax=[Clostridium] fimetarium TaxID=99656 RepID=A0A1I0RHQ9_9FIRM|nr:glycosyltransferase [[Clostridium] fimetarium]SEW39799.1 Glycosyltransferase involved in cell wall bisynthesis [[Clostridium] fimetarium]
MLSADKEAGGSIMKVLLINSDCGYGSTGRICVDLYKLIVESGNDACIAYGRDCTDESVKNIRIGGKLDVYAHVIKTRLLDLQGFGSKRATIKFINQCKAYNPDIIHLHNIHGSYINIDLLFKYIKEMKLPVIWTLHDCWAFTGHCAYYTYVGCSKWKDCCYDCIQRNLYPASIFRDNSKKNYIFKKELFNGIENLKITTVSNWLKFEVMQSYLNKYDVQVIPNGIDLDIFKPTESDFRQKFDLENKTIILGVASIWHDRKGLWLFNELADRLDNFYKIVLVGITEKQKNNLSSNILVIQRTNDLMELAEIYTAADLFLNPSIEETFGMVSLEALACGTPVISNKYSANPELINEQCGIIVEDITTQLYIDAIQKFKTESIDILECVKKAQQYNKNSCYKKYLELYEGC